MLVRDGRAAGEADTGQQERRGESKGHARYKVRSMYAGIFFGSGLV